MAKNPIKAGDASGLNDEERLLISRASELSARSQNSAVASCFLTPAEQKLLFEAGVSGAGFFFGGAPGCTRRRLVFLPGWLDAQVSHTLQLFSREREKAFLEVLDAAGAGDMLDGLFSSLELRGSGYVSLTHRDWLGSLTGLGVKREMLGDIFAAGDKTVLFADPIASAFITEELKKAGRDTVAAEKISLGRDFEVEYSFEDMDVTVASMRLDGIVKALCSVSREEAGELVLRGMTALNYSNEIRGDRKVGVGDVVSVRGYGKFVINGTGGETRKGRIRLSVKKYI